MHKGGMKAFCLCVEVHGSGQAPRECCRMCHTPSGPQWQVLQWQRGCFTPMGVSGWARAPFYTCSSFLSVRADYSAEAVI